MGERERERERVAAVLNLKSTIIHKLSRFPLAAARTLASTCMLARFPIDSIAHTLAASLSRGGGRVEYEPSLIFDSTLSGKEMKKKKRKNRYDCADKACQRRNLITWLRE